MLIRVTVENFKSFDERVELSMVSSSKIRKHPRHVVMVRGAKVLRHAAVYGANASGKSNLIASLRFVQQVLRGGLPLSSSRLYCRNSDKNAQRESTFEVQFSLGDQVYAYGFSAILKERRITGEWLFDIGSTPARSILERSFTPSDAGGSTIGTSVKMGREDRARFSTYADDFSDNDNSLFLSELNRSKRFSEGSPLSVFRRTYDWLVGGMLILSPMQPLPNPSYFFKAGLRDTIGRIVASFDTGISEIETYALTMEELADLVPRSALRMMLEESERQFNSGESVRTGYTYRGRDNLVAIEFVDDGSYEAFVVRLRHGGEDAFDFGEESEGTQRLFDLIYLLVEPADDLTFVIDELDRSLHPMLVRHFLELFMEMGRDKRTQLLFSSHEASVMDQELFRRDEIWFIDRGQDGCSRIFSLDRFKERYDAVVSKAYLEGRYGAVPVFSKAIRGVARGE